MCAVKLQRDPSLPLHEQVAAALRRDIVAGDVRPGGRLPPARDMAAVMGVHPNTVFRALRMLRDEGVLDFRRGRGISVVGKPEQGIVTAKARELLMVAQRWGYRRDDLIELIQGLP